MSIYRARLKNGRDVYSDEGEALRDEIVICKNCGAKMHIRRFPGKTDEYLFALNPGEKHVSVCMYYEGAKDAPVLTGESPNELIELLSKKSMPGKGGGGKNGGGGNISGVEISPPKKHAPKKITRLAQIITTGIYDENPYEESFKDSNYRFIDYIIFDKWGRYVWKDSILNDIGARIVDARWIGSFSLGEAWQKKIIGITKATKEIWFTMFWKVHDKYACVRFCFDCTLCFSDIKKKIFTSGIKENRTYDDFVPKKGEKLDVLVGAYWATMEKEQCEEKCPIKKCTGCLGAYWGKCNSAKQIELFPADELTKNKEKKIYG